VIDKGYQIAMSGLATCTSFFDRHCWS